MRKSGAATELEPRRTRWSRRSYLYAVIAGTFLLSLMVISAFFFEYIRQARLGDSFNAFLEAKGEVERLDEVLTMSAVAGAVTGDPAWRQRYDANVPLLDAALERALAMGSEKAHGSLAATSDANDALIAMERQAFALGLDKRNAEALAILQSADYRRQKTEYAAGVSRALEIHRQELEWRWRIGAAVFGALGVLGIATVTTVSLTWKRVIDAQLDARAQLENAEADLSKVLELAEAIPWETDLRSCLTTSPADLSVFLAAEKPPDGRTDFWNRCLHPDDLWSVKALVRGHAQAQLPLDREIRVRLADGRYCWTRLVARTDIDEAGRSVRAVGLMQNIEKRKSYERELEDQRTAAEAASIAKSQFLATMSHEIRTPMNGVLGMLDMLLGSRLDDTQHWHAKVACDSANALLRILNDILDYSKLEAGQVEIEATDFNIREVTGEIVTLLGPRGEEKRLAVTSSVDEDVPDWLVGDPVRYRQVLTNLVGNAIKFTERGSVSIHVGYRPGEEGGELQVEVRDTGIGISPEAQTRLFQRFAQADATTTRKYGGTGLGLAITKQLVEMMGGVIGLESAPGEGSTFRFTIAVREGAPPVEKADEAREEAAAAPALAPLRILLAEDNKVNQMIVRAFLKPDGHHLVTVDNGLLAVEKVQSEPFDLVLMDVQMPVMDGPSAVRLIRQLPAPLNAMPVIALTANALAGDREFYLQAGMTDYLAKPFDSKALLNVIGRVMAERPSEPDYAGKTLRQAGQRG